MKMIVALGILLAQAPAQVSAPVSAPRACVFTAPAGWNQGATRWDGECREGHADGRGVLKEYQQQKVVRFFFGRLEHGVLKLGVIDQPEGFAPLPSAEDRQQTIDAFAEAEKAADEAAARFSKAGKPASAQFYASKARELREQLD